LYFQDPCDAGNDLVLHLQQIGAIGIELIGPQMRAPVSASMSWAFTRT
jgi:hypothetical protein